jgi:hypothetical protein
MLKATNEERGTVAGLAALSQELDDVSADGMSISLVNFYCSFLTTIIR